MSGPFAFMLLLFPVSELAISLYRRAGKDAAQHADRGSIAVIWVVITLAVSAAFIVRGTGMGPIPLPRPWLEGVGIVIMVVGLGIRWAAIVTLGRFFTVNVAIAQDHRLVRSGLYGTLRHPSYSGALLAFLGMGVGLGAWPALLTLFLPIAATFLWRITIEERALREAFGAEYEDYARTTRRLIPFFY